MGKIKIEICFFFFEEAKMDYNIKSLTISAQAVPKIQLKEYQLQ